MVVSDTPFTRVPYDNPHLSFFIYRFEFIGEEGLDAGGVAREWFQVTSDQLFNPDFALFQYSAINQMCLQINASSGIANDQHLTYFHFAGRLLGKALFDGQIVPSHLVSPLYKVSGCYSDVFCISHSCILKLSLILKTYALSLSLSYLNYGCGDGQLLLGWPIAFADLLHLDNYTHDSLIKLTELEDVSICVLDFSTTVVGWLI